MPISYTLPQLVQRYTEMFAETPDPGHSIILAALQALPEGEYAELDGEGDEELPVWVYALGGPVVALRPGYTMMSGDLTVKRLETRCGAGLLISWAVDLYIVPTQLVGFMAAE